MGIFPLWSGVLLGDISRHTKSRTHQTDVKLKPRETDCHIELWFQLVKDYTLSRKRYLRPADFISKMFVSIQGQYIEHIREHNMKMESILNTTWPSSKTCDDEEQWAKSDSSAGQAKSKSKYFRPPKNLPTPKQTDDTTVKEPIAQSKDKYAQVHIFNLFINISKYIS